MPKTDRTKRPQCHWCDRTIVKGKGGWRHKHTGRVECSRQPMTASLHGKRVAQPPDGQIAMHRSLPVTTADLKALNERVTELRRRMPDDELNTILQRLHENGEFLWADEAHVEGALARIDDVAQWDCVDAAKVDHIGRVAVWLDTAKSLGLTSREIAERLSEAAGEMVAQTIEEEELKDDAEWLADELSKGRPLRA